MNQFCQQRSIKNHKNLHFNLFMKKALIITILLVAALFLSVALVQAKPDNSNQGGNNDSEYTIPEQNGTYSVPDHPNLKVRVFVHNPKVKPEPPTKPSVSSLVCNFDPPSAAVVDLAGWHLPTGSWTYRLNNSSVPSSVGSDNLSTFAQLAFGTWSGASDSKVTFVEGSPTTVMRAKYDGQNIVSWGRTSGSALAVTYTWYYPSTGLVAETDTIMNQKFPWSWTNQTVSLNCAGANSYDAQDILTHELGHWMGLDDEYTSTYVDNTMYGYGSKGEVKKDTLTAGDIAGISNIYH